MLDEIDFEEHIFNMSNEKREHDLKFYYYSWILNFDLQPNKEKKYKNIQINNEG